MRPVGFARAWICLFVKRLILEIRFILFRLLLRRNDAAQEITVVVLTCSPNPILEGCLDSIRRQTLKARSIEVVSDVFPVSKAEQEGLDRVKTKYYISVDGDMVLDKSCFERLYFLIKVNPSSGSSRLPVIDPILGPVLAGGRMYLTAPVQEIGYHPFSGARDHDRYMKKELAERGYDTVSGKWIVGKHHPMYLPHEAYWKFRVNAEKARFYGNRYPCFQEMVDRISEYWMNQHEDIALYALAGLFSGMQSDRCDRELTYEGRTEDSAYVKLKQFLDECNGSDNEGASGAWIGEELCIDE
jgi:hypothetical protein